MSRKPLANTNKQILGLNSLENKGFWREAVAQIFEIRPIVLLWGRLLKLTAVIGTF
jgi:hypothetical protein